MRDLLSREPPPKWHLVLLGCLAAGGVAGLGLFLHDRALVFASVFCGLFVGGFGFLLIGARSRAMSTGVGTRPTAQSAIQHIRLAVILGLLASIVLGYLHKR
jgi:hypothetical protein